jgi:quinol monooxygenase YgiN
MGGRRRRDDGWDEGRGDRQDGWRDPRQGDGREGWQGDGREGWHERGPDRADGRHRAALPASGGWQSAGDRSAGGDWPPVTGYQAADAQGGYQTGMGQGGYQPAAGQGGYQPAAGQGGYQPAAGQGGYQPAIGQGGAAAYGGGPGYGDAGYGAAPSGAGAFPGGGQGFAGPGYQEQRFPTTGYAETGYPGNGYSGNGYSGNGSTGYASGAGDTRYGDHGGTGYGHSGAVYPDAGYGNGDWSGGGYQDPGYTQPAAPGGSWFGDGAAHDASANGRASGSYAADTTAVRRPEGEFPETSATAQYGSVASWEPDLASGEYGPSGQSGQANGIPSGTPRPYGRLSIFTLLEDKAAEFDRLAEQAAEGVRTAEPDTLVYVIHVVPKAPMQRIIYEIYRDRQAFESHERQPHIQRFVADRKACVLATNIIDLRLKYAKVAALSAAQTPAPPASAPSASVQETRVNQAPRALESGWPAEGGGRTAGPGYGRLPGSDNRVPRSRSMDWDQPAYQGQRRGGN